MGMKRHNRNTRDANEAALLTVARTLGADWLEEGPLDGWLWVARQQRWVPVEIKKPEREGHAHEYTPAQRRFFTWCKACNAPWLVWRTTADVIRDLGGRIAA